ncbi:MAG: hypothetical protein QNJ18_22995 [Xenococcaceae cyanobacterium MO_167.B52]|nr:hypothetical protein [Xenococcaceae cyanobacterium MO_167.B52]
MSRQEYFFLNHQGECSKPNWSQVKDLDSTNKPYMLVPDNNVCIHVSDFNISKKQDKIKRIKARKFLNYVSTSNITVNPTFGLLERASKPGTLKLNISKLNDFEDAFWRKIGHYTDNHTISSMCTSIDPLKAQLYPLYAYLLKIKLILLKRKASSKNAEINLNELYSFIEEMQIYLAIPWQFALAIFGGNNQLNKFITPDKKKDLFQAIWGASWDLYYLYLTHEYNGIRSINDTYHQYIFATDDKRCAAIGQALKVIGAIDYGNIIYNHTLVSYDFPHWKQKEKFLLDMNQEIFKKTTERAIRRNQLSEKDAQLTTENIINNSTYQISKITKELKAITNKGFG